MAKYNPMETAPKDGRLILVTDGEEVYKVSWMENSSYWRLKFMAWCIDDSYHEDWGGFDIVDHPLGWLEWPDPKVE